MLEEKPRTRAENKLRVRTIILIAIIVVGVGGGIALLVSIAGGSSSGAKNSTSDVSDLGTGTVPTGNTDDMLAGSATPTYPAGDPNEIAVVYLGPVTQMQGGGATVPVVIRNNTTSTVSHIALTGIAEDATGTHIATGTSQQAVEPAQLTVGTIGYTYIHFAATSVVPPPDAVYEFTVKSSPADTSTLNTASIKVTRSDATGTSITGVATNTNGRKLRGPYTVQAFCFDDKQNLISVQSAVTNQVGNIPLGGAVNFAVPLNGATCTNYLVGVSGFYA